MDSFLNQISAKQALEWELFNQENPPFEEELLFQLAHTAQIFASSFIKKKDRSGWTLLDFMPFRLKKKKESDSNKSLLDGIKGIVRLAGDKKAKKRLLKEEEQPKVKGTDGKFIIMPRRICTRTKPRKVQHSNHKLPGKDHNGAGQYFVRY
jgi:hypothetical protein